ncbi:hypothetical protein BDW_10190 [Bdellovibrio bacteriovorus W]|nr:hypothetical protein BDW_10190 [Bdellovibrio bacteriovorus W]
MRYAIALVMALFPFQSIAGVGGGGVGPRPTMTFSKNVDLIRTLEINNDKVTFLYKPFDESLVSKQTINLSEINRQFLQAIINSQKLDTWSAISISE